MNRLPFLLGAVLASLVTFALATTRYPGGYDWANRTISALFQPLAANGTPNSARPIAVLAVLLFCSSIGVVFKLISTSTGSRVHRKAIEIGGIGSMVYAFLVVTPMHDLMVTIGLVFFLTAMFSILHLEWSERKWRLVFAGVAALTLPLLNAAMYYGQFRYDLLPLVQKVAMLGWVGWLFAVLWSRRASSNA